MTDPAIVRDLAIVTQETLQRQRALSCWDNEGGARSHASRFNANTGLGLIDDPVLSNAELVQLRVRVIALENLVIAILAKASGEQLDLIREMAELITPRPEATQHPLTIRAAKQMHHLVDRTCHFKPS